MTTIPVYDPITIDFAKGQRTPRPLPPIGNPIDGQRGEDISALWPDTAQVTTITLGGSTATDDATTLVITPTKSPAGSPWADGIGPVRLNFTTGATQTLEAVAAGLIAAAVTAGTISTLADLNAGFKRLRDLARVTAVDGQPEQIKISAVAPGWDFTVAIESTGSVTKGAETTVGGDDDKLRIGVFAVRGGYTDVGYPKVAKPSASSTSADTLGVVMDSIVAEPSEPGQPFKLIKRGRDAMIRVYGTCSVYGEKACARDAQVYYRKVVGVGEIEGAVTDTATTDVVQVVTVTPTEANTTLYRAIIEVLDFWTGSSLAAGIIEYTSDADATPTEICDGLRTSLANENDQLDNYVTGSGTATMILTAAAGVTIMVSPTSPGVLDVVETTAAASDHERAPGAKFIETTLGAGPQAIFLPHP